MHFPLCNFSLNYSLVTMDLKIYEVIFQKGLIMKHLRLINSANGAILAGIIASFFSCMFSGALFPFTKIFAISLILPGCVLAAPHLGWASIICSLFFARSLFMASWLLNLFYPATLMGGLFMRYSHENKHTRLFFSLLVATCFASFLLHPVGSQSSAYTFFWFMPLCFLLSSGHSAVFRSIASVFMTHALGTIIYLYSHVTTPSYWISLMPLVIVERLFMASGILLLSVIFSFLISLIKKLTVQNSSRIATSLNKNV
jgi:hypothetical protein